MSIFIDVVTKTLLREGGSRITNVSSDRGGLTKFGISQRSYPNVDIENLTEVDAIGIYKKDYWDRISGDKISSERIAENIFDTAVNMGVNTASRFAQVVVDLDLIDGIIGSKTLAKINGCNEEIFILKYTLTKIEYYAKICNKDRTQGKFLLGWINRALGI